MLVLEITWLYRFVFAKLHNLAYRNTAATLVQPGEGSLY